MTRIELDIYRGVPPNWCPPSVRLATKRNLCFVLSTITFTIPEEWHVYTVYEYISGIPFSILKELISNYNKETEFPCVYSLCELLMNSEIKFT